jgi:hydrogenase maturation protease
MQASSHNHEKQVHFVGIGSFYGDDCIGLCIARQIKKQSSRNLRVDQASSPIRLFDLLFPADLLVICDAWASDCDAVGSLRKWVWPNIEIENIAFSGSHDLSLGAVLHLSERLAILPPKVFIWGIGVACQSPSLSCQSVLSRQQEESLATPGNGIWPGLLSKDLSDLVPTIVDRIITDISNA